MGENMIPNMIEEVRRTRDAHPQAWKHAHTGSPQSKDFIRLLAERLHAINPAFGLNGKRGNYDDLSEDAINFIGEGPGHDPKTGRPVTVFDVIRGAGGPNPEASWDLIDLPGAGGWVQPGPSTAPELPKPIPTEPPFRVLSKPDAYAALQRLNAFYASQDGLQRPGGLVRHDDEGRTVADVEAMAQWFLQLVVEGASWADVEAQIRQSAEWRDKHPNG